MTSQDTDKTNRRIQQFSDLVNAGFTYKEAGEIIREVDEIILNIKWE